VERAAIVSTAASIRSVRLNMYSRASVMAAEAVGGQSVVVVVLCGRRWDAGAHRRVLAHSGPLVRVKSRDLAAGVVEREPRTLGVRDRQPLLTDGRTLDVADVVWTTGFRPDTSWIDLQQRQA
jgi:hypothetical protein